MSECFGCGLEHEGACASTAGDALMMILGLGPVVLLFAFLVVARIMGAAA